MDIGWRVDRCPRRRCGGRYKFFSELVSVEHVLDGRKPDRTVGNADRTDMRIEHPIFRVQIVKKRHSGQGEIALSAGELKKGPAPGRRPRGKVNLGQNFNPPQGWSATVP